MQLMSIGVDRRYRTTPYALTQWYLPKIEVVNPGTTRVHPVLDMLNVRYLIFRGPPPQRVQPWRIGDDYWILRNPKALPRVFVPQRVETIGDELRRLTRMAANDFDARQLALIEQMHVDLPDSCRGSATIQSEIPRRLVVDADMETRGLLVVADLWDKGWAATVNGQPAPILRTNHALRGVLLPAGKSQVIFQYTPSSFTWGLYLLVVAVSITGLWSGWIAVKLVAQGFSEPGSARANTIATPGEFPW